MTLRSVAVLCLSLTLTEWFSWSQMAPDHPEAAGAQRVSPRREETRCDAAAPLREPIRAGRNVQNSKLRSSVQPVYPGESKGTGKILLQVTINESGAVHSIVFLNCPAPLKDAVRAAVCRWRYEPTFMPLGSDLQTEPVPVIAIVELSYNFARYRI